MASKKKTPTASSLQTLKIGGRVRCTDNGVQGRIVWANGVSVKIKWDDGEQVTWRRDSLASRPIEILAGDEGPSTASAPPAADEAPESPAAETPSAAPESAQEPPVVETPASDPTLVETPPAATDTATAAEPPLLASGSTAAETAETAGAGQTIVRPKRPRKASVEPKEKKLSALDAAAKVLGEAGQAMTCQEMIRTMKAQDYWSSPGGKTPSATLYSAILREVQTKGTQSRFVKAERGQFARRPTA